MSPPLPVIICGRMVSVGKIVIEGIKPDYQGPVAVRFITSVEMGVQDIPAIIQGREPLSGKPASEADLGTGDYSRPPIAILAGGGYDDEAVATMREAVQKETGDAGAKIPWFRPDMSKPPPPPGKDYGQYTVERVKARMAETFKNGEADNGGEFWY